MKQIISTLLLGSALLVFSQPPPRDRGHTATTAQKLKLVPAKFDPPAESKVSIVVEGDQRIISANVMPDNKIGRFPNRGNPNKPTEQEYKIVLPLKPEANKFAIEARRDVGVLIDGVLLEAGTGEFWHSKADGSEAKPWNYNALGGAINLGLDANHAHVQPTGKYHYHGLPIALLERLKVSAETHSPLIGWAYDGFPIYALYGYQNGKGGEIIENTSSYRLKKGQRPAAPTGPDGAYDGAFNDDYEFVKGAGTLDECNGRFTITPEFPEGTYAYFLTNEWPVILTKYRGPAVRPEGEPKRRHPTKGAGGPRRKK